SVLAKTHRDEYMHALHAEFPAYCWDRNKAYPTAVHRQAIKIYGVTPLHRLTFDLTGEKKLLKKKTRKFP
ncbi:MAG: ribonuclease HII, partial [Paludibacter sp.]|nr:ribonuclease HII [Paludibacter sp.]